MLEIRRHLDLGEKALDAQHGTKLGLQHLDGDIAIVLQIAREIDGGHTAHADLADDGVAIGDCVSQVLEVGHGRPIVPPRVRERDRSLSHRHGSQFTVDEIWKPVVRATVYHAKDLEHDRTAALLAAVVGEA